MEKIANLVGDIPLELPPLQEVNPEINLIDPDKRMRYRLPKCPEHFREELSLKLEWYTTAKWWIPAVAHQAVPMLCLLLIFYTLHTVFDLRQQNENTVKDVMPFLDQDVIRSDVAHCKYRTKLNMSETYEWICISC
ncbi:hypothetical protein JB92DRAFT_2810122 [Gautieria morchelliformis]|nr:hypothetical protein JB92DRAFT_2810122 [Gautieria morchelliformis]